MLEPALGSDMVGAALLDGFAHGTDACSSLSGEEVERFAQTAMVGERPCPRRIDGAIEAVGMRGRSDVEQRSGDRRRRDAVDECHVVERDAPGRVHDRRAVGSQHATAGLGDVHRRGAEAGDTGEVQGRVVRCTRAGTRVEDGRHHGLERGGRCAGVQEHVARPLDQRPGGDAPSDRVSSDACEEELGSTDGAMLPSAEVGDVYVQVAVHLHQRRWK
ncbi:MAG: hypothetical protein R2699_14335 [Acidimicrobiales bacterium]